MTPNVNVLDSLKPVNGLTCHQNYISTSIDNFRLIKKPEVLALTGISKSTLHVRINNGLMPPPVSLGGRAVAFVLHEIKAVLMAQIAGCSNDKIQSLVAELVQLRQGFYEMETKLCST